MHTCENCGKGTNSVVNGLCSQCDREARAEAYYEGINWRIDAQAMIDEEEEREGS